MHHQLLNPQTGEFTLNNNFVVSNKTTVEDLLAHFGQDNMQLSDMHNGYCNYSTKQIQIGELYFNFTFNFFNKIITKLSFNLQPELYEANADWDNFNEQENIKKGKFMEQWMAKQMKGDFKRYDWGKVGTYYDFHNLSTTCNINYTQS